MLRLHGRCPQCSRVEPLRPDGTGALTQHTAPPRGFSARERRCDGSGAQPAEGSVEAWLATQAAGADARVESAERAVAKALADLNAARQHAATHGAWIARQRARLAKGRE